MDKRHIIIENLKRLIRDRKAEIDPRVLSVAQRAAQKAHGMPDEKGTVPYDRKSAAEAVELFLASHPDRHGFREKLLEFLKKKSH